MPRKTAQNKKSGSQAAKKLVSNDDTKSDLEKPPRRGKDNLSDGDRARRSSTAAQTAASVQESRGTRTRTGRLESSDGHKTSGRDNESSRVRTSRRAASRVNYKESDGEEEIPTPKNEDNFASDEELNDSGSEEHSKPKKTVRSPSKRASAVSQKGKGKGASRVREKSSRRKAIEESKIEESEEVLLDDSDDEKLTKKEAKDGGGKSQKGTRSSVKPQTAENTSRKSSRSRSVKSETPVSRRPSRGTKVKKYTEVEEDFDEEVKSDDDLQHKEDKDKEEVEAEEEKVVDKSETEPEVKDSRKRKRESEYEPNKRAKKDGDVDVAEKKQNQHCATDELKNDEKEESLEEPMEIDESVSEVDDEKKDMDVKPVAKIDVEPINEKIESQKTDTAEKPKSSELNSNEADLNAQEESNHLEKMPDIVPSKKDTEAEEKNNTPTESKSNTPGVIKSVEKEAMQATSTNVETTDEKTKDFSNCTQPKPTPLLVEETTFLSEEQSVNSSLNGQSDKSVICEKSVQPEKSSTFHYQNSSVPPKENGAHDDLHRTCIVEQISERCYVGNSRFNNLVEGQKENNFFRFGCVSCNLFLSALQPDKLVHELDKQAGIICIQNVSKSLFYDVFKRNFDALGFKAVTCWTNNSDFGLVTLYKTSLFRLSKETGMPVRTLLEKRLDNSQLDDEEKSATFQMLGKCGNVLLTEFATVPEETSQTIKIVNVKIPSTTSSLHALQFMCLNQELAAQSNEVTKHLICGEFNTMEHELPYQMLRHGKLSDHSIDELKSQVNSAESFAATKIISKSLYLPTLKLTSCYHSAMGKELTIPESKTTSPELLFTCGEDVHTIGVLDLPSNYAEKVRQGQIPLKADIAIGISLTSNDPVV